MIIVSVYIMGRGESERQGVETAGMFCRLQVAGCGLKFSYNWKTAGTKNNQ